MGTRYRKLHQQREFFVLNVLQWNTVGLSGIKFVELKKIVEGRDCDSNAASPSWGYACYNRVREIVEDYADSNGLTLSYNEKAPKTLVTMVWSLNKLRPCMMIPNLFDGCRKIELDDPGK
ncbi:hypothetical protein NPIL_241101 [Nephila pilipes]|uniref:Uncharacterized protein n=1 Tax=Nephila pilipes TaxID=299642 RepID=A0A8X6URN3_NEPPI|nr:hypothetical protein NPIL_241101 [Nephila pilipes]